MYFTHPIFGMFMRHGIRAYKQLVLNALDRLLPNPLVTTDAPTTAHITLLRQAEKHRHILHVLHYIPEHRYKEVQTIEEAIPLRDLRVAVTIPVPQEVYLAPSRCSLDFRVCDGMIHVTISQVRGHAVVVFEDRSSRNKDEPSSATCV